jgi:hypothetical protein
VRDDADIAYLTDPLDFAGFTALGLAFVHSGFRISRVTFRSLIIARTSVLLLFKVLCRLPPIVPRVDEAGNQAPTSKHLAGGIDGEAIPFDRKLRALLIATRTPERAPRESR